MPSKCVLCIQHAEGVNDKSILQKSFPTKKTTCLRLRALYSRKTSPVLPQKSPSHACMFSKCALHMVLLTSRNFSKCPILPQKSPILPQKSPILLQTSPSCIFALKMRAVHARLQRVLLTSQIFQRYFYAQTRLFIFREFFKFLYKKALCFHKRALYSRK